MKENPCFEELAKNLGNWRVNREDSQRVAEIQIKIKSEEAFYLKVIIISKH